MYEFGQLAALMFLGASFIFLVKGVLEVRATGDDWKFKDFILSNGNRLALLGCLLVVGTLGLWLDPAGIKDLFEQLPWGVQISSPLAAGAALSGVVMMLNRNESVPPIE